MKYFRAGLLSTVMVALCMSGMTQAGQREGAFSVSPMVGYHVFEGDQNTGDDMFAGFSLGYNVSKKWAAEAEVRYTATETDLSGTPDEDIDVWSFAVNALYHFNPDGPFVPYLSAGFGGMYFDVDGFDDDSDYMMNWGAGAKYFMSDDLALRMDLRHVLDLHSDRQWDRTHGDDLDNNFLASAGLYLQFAGPAPAARAPLDSDGDGIPDLRDKCPDTPFGVMVDAVGCPPVEKTLPLPVVQQPVVRQPVVMQPVPQGTKEIITFNLRFGFDKYKITDEMLPKLAQAKLILNEDPAATFLILGHTCSIGSDSYNQKLSERRADSVKDWLVSNGIAAARLESIGYGENRPRHDNSNEESRQLNRRVEITTQEK